MMGSMIFMMLGGAAAGLGIFAALWALSYLRVPKHEREVVAALEAELRLGLEPEKVIPGWNPSRSRYQDGAPCLCETGGQSWYPISQAGERRLYAVWRESLLAEHCSISAEAQAKEAQRIERRDRKRAQKP